MRPRRKPNVTEPATQRPPRLVAAGFLLAFAASIATVVLTGLWVRAPAPEPAQEQGAPPGSQPAGTGRGVPREPRAHDQRAEEFEPRAVTGRQGRAVADDAGRQGEAAGQ